MSDRTLEKFFSYQPYKPKEDSEGCMVFLIEMKINRDKSSLEPLGVNEGITSGEISIEQMSFSMNRYLITDFIYTEQELVNVIEKKCREVFPVYEPKDFVPTSNPTLDIFEFSGENGYTNTSGIGFFNLTSMKTGIARTTRRGNRALNIFPGVYTYVGNTRFDRPIVVSKNLDTGLYGVFFIPGLERYGRIVK